MARAVSFFELEMFDVRFGITVTKDIKMDGVAIALPKKWCSQAGLLWHSRSVEQCVRPLTSDRGVRAYLFRNGSIGF